MDRRKFLGLIGGGTAALGVGGAATAPAQPEPGLTGPTLRTDPLGNLYQRRRAAMAYRCGDWFVNDLGKGVGLCTTDLHPGEYGWILVFRRLTGSEPHVTTEDTGLVWRDPHLP